MANKKNSASETLKPVPEIPASVMDHIYYVADTMIGKSNLVEADRCDLIQEMSIAVCRAKTLLDANGKSATGSAYLNKAVDLTAKNIYRQRIRKHNDTPCLPIEDCLRDEKKEKSAVITPMIDDSDKKILYMDIRVVVASLPDDLRRICELIMDGHTFEQIGEILGIPDATIRIWRMKKIREIFVRSGIKL